MEHLWSRAVATGGNRWQMGLPRKRLEQAKTVAMGCDQLPGPQNGKEGVDGFESVRGLCKMPANGHFLVTIHLHRGERTPGIEPFMELSGREVGSARAAPR